MKKLIIGLSCAMATSLSSAAMAAEEVKIGAPAWTGAQAIAHLIKEAVKRKPDLSVARMGSMIFGMVP